MNISQGKIVNIPGIKANFVDQMICSSSGRGKDDTDKIQNMKTVSFLFLLFPEWGRSE